MKTCTFILALILTFPAICPAFDATTCAKNSTDVGIVASEIIKDRTDNMREWVFLLTPTKTINAYLSELESVPCSSILPLFSKAKQKLIEDWLEGGTNPIMLDDFDDTSGLSSGPLGQLSDTLTGTVTSMTEIHSDLNQYSDDITKALQLAIKHLHPADYLTISDSMYTPASTRLRMQADEMDQRDRDIEFIESVLKLLHE